MKGVKQTKAAKREPFLLGPLQFYIEWRGSLLI